MLELKLMGEFILFLKKSKKVLLFEHLDITLKLKYFLKILIKLYFW